jgi:hypothetical protein
MKRVLTKAVVAVFIPITLSDASSPSPDKARSGAESTDRLKGTVSDSI